MGATLTWRGRELSSYSKGNIQISYSYDVDGMRYQKIVKNNGTETARYDYVYSDGKIILLTHTANGTANTARFIYDSFGEPRGFILNNSASYLYLKNGQGDIVAIVDENGEILVRYTYNAWGAVEFIVPFGIDPAVTTVLATVSPFTYRGYCYDFDLGLYYLQSRYYDPEICRFINADSTDYLGATGTLLSYNLFAYCENDGVNFFDEKGTSSVSFLKDSFKQFKNGDSALNTFCKLLWKNGKNFYTAFHELAQILIARKVSNNGYYVELERPCSRNKQKEIDVYASKRFSTRYKEYIWEVKPLGTSAKNQLNTYLSLNPGVTLGCNIGTINQKICKNLKIKITFDGKGGAFYSFWNDKNERITNKCLQDAIKAGVYKALAIGVAALTIAIITTVIVIVLSGGSAAVPATKVAAVSASAVSKGSMAVIIPFVAEGLAKAA